MIIKQDVRIKLDFGRKEDRAQAELLSRRLGLARLSADEKDVRFYFAYNNDRLELFLNMGKEQLGPLYVDFLSGAGYYRYQHDRRIKQPLARAAGIKPGRRPVICDVTAGLGGDSFVLATLGCSVTMIERSSLVWALLDDGIRRAGYHPDIGRIFKERLSLYHGDSASFISSSNKVFDTILMDPMYPQRKKSALNKQEMRLLRHVVGEDTDSDTLLQTARRYARNRVVVKRPAGAPSLTGDPAFSLKGKSSRYDVYLAHHL